MVCPRCQGLFGAGPTSPLWLFYKTVQADARGFTFDVPGVTDGLVCGGDGLCNAVMDVVVTNPDGSVAYAGPHEVVVLMQESRTLLPAAVYNAVRGIRIPGRTPIDEWPTLVLSGTNSFAAFSPYEYLRSRPGDTMTTFSFGKSPDARIVLGHEAFLALGVVRDWGTGKAIIYDVVVIAENGALTLLLLILMAMAYGLGHRSPTFFLPFEPGRLGQYFTVIFVEIVAVGLAPALLLSSRVINVLFRETAWAVVLCCAIGYFSLTVFFGRIHKTLFESSFQRHLWAIVRDGSRGGALVMALFLLALQTSAARWYTPLSLAVLVLAGYEFVHVWRNALAYGWRFSFESFFWLWFAGYFAFSVAALTAMGRNVLLIATQWLFPAGGTPYWLLTFAIAALGLAFFSYIARADIARIWRWVMLPATDPKIDRPAKRFY